MRSPSIYLLCLSLVVLSLLAPSLVPASSVSADRPLVFLAKWGTGGTAEGQFDLPRGIAVDSSGNVYVADSFNHRIQKFDGDGTFLRMWGWGVDSGANSFEVCTNGCQAGSGGANDGQFSAPYDVAVDAAGNVWVADQHNNRIQKFDSDGTFLLKSGTVGVTGDNFQDPRGVAVDAAGTVYVADWGNDRVKKHYDNGDFFITWGWGVLDGTVALQTCAWPLTCQAGIGGSGAGQFHYPTAIAVDSTGNVYVADSSNHRIQKFSSVYVLLTEWGQLGSGEGDTSFPTGVTVDAAGDVYVVASNHVQKFDSGGNYLTGWGLPYVSSTDGNFDGAYDVAVDSKGIVYVSDSNNNRIQKFGPALGFFVGEEELPPGR